MTTEGSKRVTNILQDLSDPTAIAVSNGYLYWAELGGRIRRVNLTADQKVAMNIATDLGEPVSIAVAKGKIYWLEHFSTGRGRLQRANLDGTKIEELKDIHKKCAIGIAIDGLDNKIYWTRSMGVIQRSNLAGRVRHGYCHRVDETGYHCTWWDGAG